MSKSIKRVGPGHFAKGQSGNPNGRPKGFKGLARKLMRETEGGEELIKFALDVFRGTHPTVGRTAADRKWAFEWLSNHIFGKAPDRLIVDRGDSETVITGPNVADMSEADLLALEKAANIMSAAIEKDAIDV